MPAEEGAPACTRHLICSLPFLSLSFPIRMPTWRRCAVGGPPGGPLSGRAPTPTPLSSERSGCWLGRKALPGRGPGFPQTLPAPCGGLWGDAGRGSWPFKSLGVIDRSLGNAIRLSATKGGLAGAARGKRGASWKRLPAGWPGAPLLAGAWPARGAGNPDPLQENRSGSVPAVRPLWPRGRAKPCATRGVGWGSL